MFKTNTRRAAFVLLLLMHAHAAAQPSAPAADSRGRGVKVKIEGAEVSLYAESHALVVGVSEYARGWPNLSGVKEDVEKVSAELRRHGFTVDVVLNPTRAEFDRAMRRFVSRYGNKEDGRLLVYFAGHGYTAPRSYGGSLGYVVPSDAPLPTRDVVGFKEAAVPMSELEDYARQIEARHALFVFDSCFSGSLFERGGRTPPPAITSLAARPVRQFITAGTAEQTVPDQSFFRVQFVEGLAGAADANRDGYVTGSELGIFLQDTVTNYSRNAQTPRWGKINDARLDKGDFVFVVPRPAAPGKAAPGAPAPPDPKALAEGYGRSGEKLYAEDRYDRAENEFRLAAHYDPADARWHLGLARSLHLQDRDAEAEAAAREAARLAPGDPAAFMLLGDILRPLRFAEAQAAWGSALLLYREAARREPAKAEWQDGAAEALQHLGRDEEALAARREAVRLDGRSAERRVALANLLTKFDRDEEALAEVREAVRLEPKEAAWQDRLALALEAVNKAGEAVEAHRAAVRLDPKEIAYYESLGGHLSHLTEDHEGAEKVYREAVRNLPDEPRAYIALSHELRDMNRPAEAEQVLREGLRRVPDSVSLHVTLGRLYAAGSKNAEAEAAFRKAVQLDPKSEYAVDELAGAYEKWGRLAEAEAVCREGLKAIPESGNLFQQLITVLKKQKKDDAVEAEYRRAVQRRPREAGPRRELGWFHLEAKRYADAELAYREAIRLDEKDPGLRARLAEALKGLGRPAEAAAAYREAIRLAPESYDHYGALGGYLLELNDNAGSEAVWREALLRLNRTGERVNAYNNLGVALARQDKFAQAESAYREALRLDPKRAWSHYALGISLWNQKRMTEAEAELRQAVALEPGDKDFRALLDKFLAARQK